jgi:SAM-dependent methyltransferase
MVGVTAAVTWHDVENGAYDADLPLWRELAGATGGPVLDLGAGTGRVAIDLAAHGHEVVALDSDGELLAALAERAPEVTTVTADARGFDLGVTFALILAPMQLLQILGGPDGRLAMLRRVRAHLQPGGTFAAAIANPYEAIPGADAEPPIPDMLERDGWVFSSQPVTVRERNGHVVVTRRRQAVSPTGALAEETVEITLDVVDVEGLDEEARAAGLTRAERRTIAETPDHVGSTVIVCRR